ncbi:phytase [Brevundimonas sp.]|uniref:phytase n=1 Tax=Brevundimonas sp. TaxID=1871086 RepID=UPI003D120B54
MSNFRFSLACVSALALFAGACATPLTGEETDVSDAGEMTVGAGTPVLAAAETVAVGTANADAADDPAIWVDPRDPSRVVIFGTDKKAGLYSYRLDGTVLQNLAGGNPNNVDLRDGFMVGGRSQVLVAASDRSPDRFGITLFLMDPTTLQTRYWGLVPVDLEEPYGLCVGKRGDQFIVMINGTDGQVRQVAVSAGADGAPAAVEQKRYAVGSQTEGCVIDDETGYVYIGEEARGVWRYSLDPAQGSRRISIAQAPSAALVPDVEGLAMLKQNGETWLFASSQGDSAFAVWRVDGQPTYRGRFSVVSGGGIDAVTGTDGIAALAGPVGPYSQGLIVVQDDVDEIPGSTGERQNFKLVDWAAIRAALGL